MNGKRSTMLICALAVSALIVWHDLRIEFPSNRPGKGKHA
jgi:hypothetical protein